MLEERVGSATLKTDASLAYACARTLHICADEAAEYTDATEFIVSNRVARDAAFTLQQMGYSPEACVIMVGHDEYDLDVHLRLLARHVSQALKAIINDATTGTTQRRIYAH